MQNVFHTLRQLANPSRLIHKPGHEDDFSVARNTEKLGRPGVLYNFNRVDLLRRVRILDKYWLLYSVLEIIIAFRHVPDRFSSATLSFIDY